MKSEPDGFMLIVMTIAGMILMAMLHEQMYRASAWVAIVAVMVLIVRGVEVLKQQP